MKATEEKVKEYIDRYCLQAPGDNILVGFSGGADSTALLFLMNKIAEKSGVRVYALHVHHGIRKETADRDALFSENVCKKLGIPFALKKTDAPSYAKENNLSVEEAARILRYRALTETACEMKCKKIAVAHHMDDQAETVLFQMLRGSGLKGFGGMKPKRLMENDITLIRPLLCLKKSEIIDFLTDNAIPWVEDETNAEDEADRNRIRHTVIPALCEIRSDAVEKICETASFAAKADLYFEELSGKWLDRYCESKEEISIPCKEFLEEPDIIREYIVRGALFKINVPMKDKGRTLINDIISLTEKSVGKQVLFSGRDQKPYRAVKKYTDICISPITPQKVSDGNPVGCEIEAGNHYGNLCDFFPEAEKIRNSVRLCIKNAGEYFSEEDFEQKKEKLIPKNLYTKWLDYDKIKGLLVIRSRRIGDSISLKPGTHKKLKDFFIDEKIDREERDGILLLAQGSEIIWVIGLRLSEDYKVSAKTKTILEISVDVPEKKL